MKPRTAAIVLIAFALAGLIATGQPDVDAAKSPMPTPTIGPSPTPGPDLSAFDPYWRANPKKIKPKDVPYVDEYGDTIIYESIIEIPNHEPGIYRLKEARPKKSDSLTALEQPAFSLTTFESPLELPSEIYLPIIIQSASPPVLVIVYRNKTPLYDPTTLTNQLIVDLNTASKWHGYANPNTQPAVRYGLPPEGITIVNESPPLQANGYIDVNAVYQRFNICSRVQANQIGEVWIWMDGDYPSYSPGEFTINGPTWAIVWGGLNPPNCGKTITTFYLNFDRSIAAALHSYAHSFEYTMGWGFVPSGYETCDFHTLTLPDAGGNPAGECNGSWTPSDQYAFIARPAPVNGNVGVCGTVHWPPNLPVGYPNEYYYSVQTSAQSRCMDWQWGGGTISNVGCSAWGCEVCPDPGSDPYGFFVCNERNEERYLTWWMQNMPSLSNTSHGRTGTIRPNWWAFKFQ